MHRLRQHRDTTEKPTILLERARDTSWDGIARGDKCGAATSPATKTTAATRPPSPVIAIITSAVLMLVVAACEPLPS